jgi:hypothetical protein
MGIALIFKRIRFSINKDAIALRPKQLGKYFAQQRGQRELNLIFDFFLQKKSKIKFSSLWKVFFFPNCLGLKALSVNVLNLSEVNCEPKLSPSIKAFISLF